jgi:hypothetical protein
MLHNLLGGSCAVCGSREDLTIDHEAGRDWKIERVSRHARVTRYLAEYLDGVPLRILCIECNGRDGTWRRRDLAPTDTVPF